MKSNITALLALVLCCCLAATSVQAQQKQVQVKFQILEDDYQEFYGDSLPNLLVEGQELIATILQEELPFTKFGTAPAEHQLLITIDRQPTGLANPLIHQVDVNMKLMSGQEVVSNTISTEFRSIDRFHEPLPNSNAAFLVELAFILQDWLKEEHAAIVFEVMSQLSLAEAAHPDKDNECWILPFSEETLRIGTDSEFVVKSKLVTPNIVEHIDYQAIAKGRTQPTASIYPPQYRGKILARIKQEGAADVDKMTHSGLKVEGIYLTKYVRARPAQPFSPDDFEFASN